MAAIRLLLIGTAATIAAAALGCGGGDGNRGSTATPPASAQSGPPLTEKPTCAPARRRQIVYGEPLDRGVRFVAVRADGSGQVFLTHGGNFGKGLAISPDGCRVAYIAEGDLLPNGQEQVPKLLITNADGSGDSQSALSGIDSQSEVSWSPDGKRVAIAGGQGGLAIFDVASGDVKQIDLGDITLVHSPTWSPDGRRIAFGGATEKDVDPGGTLFQPDIYVVDVDGGNRQLVRDTPRYNEYEIAWSPDGRWIAFIDSSASTEDTTGPADHYRRGVFLLSPDGERLRRLARTTGDRPSWLPDSSAVVYARNECHGGPPASFGPCSGQTIVAVPLHGGPDRALIGPKQGLNFPGPEYARDGGLPPPLR
jgi:hypothetical protein